MKNLPKINPSKALKASLPYLIAGLLCTKLGEAYRLTTGGDVIDRLLAAFTKLGLVFQNPFPSLHPFDLLVGAAAAVLLRLVVWSKIKNAKKYRHGEEYGTARWGNEKDIAPFINSDFSQNILLTDTERLTLGKIADPEKRNVNLNVLVIGGSGSGKTRYHIKPNLLQMNASYVCSDPKGTVVEEVGRALVQQGHYKLKILNTIDFSCSMHYNPFHYLHSETDILSLVTVIMENTQSKESKGGDDFWSKAEALLYQALIAYIYYEAPEEEKNMTTLLDMLNACECREDDENFKSAVDLLFEQLEQRDANHFAVRQYKKFKMAAGKTLKSILISCGARLAPFDIQAVREMMEYDELELEKLGEEKIALFAVVSDSDPTFNFISAMMYSQMFNVLCNRALTVYHGRLPVHVTCLFDEFANQKIPNWEHLVSVIRSRNISAHIVLQTYSQLKLLISSATLCNKPFNPVCYFFIRNCTRSQYLVKRRSNGKNQPDQNIQTWFSPVIFYCREKTRADICTFCNLLTGIFSLFSCTSVRGAKGINGLLLFLSHAPSPHIIVLYLDYEVFKMI